MMDYNASITYRNPVPAGADRVREASREQRILGPALPGVQRVYAGGRGYCPIDAVELGEEHDVDLPHTGTITNFTIVTPVQYPGQTETEPFARVFVLLDGTSTSCSPTSRSSSSPSPTCTSARGSRPCGRHRTRTSTKAERWAGAYGHLIGWIPTGEPDVDDPDLVNRIF